MIEQREIAKSLKFKRFEHQQVININGQIKTLNIENFTLICPNCNTSLMQFQQGVARATILKDLAKQEWRLNYCINCGQKLSKPEIVDIETISIKEEEKTEEVNKDE